MEIVLDFESSHHLAKLCQYKDVEMPFSVFAWGATASKEIVCWNKAYPIRENHCFAMICPAYTLGELQNWLPKYIGVPGYGVTLEMKVEVPRGKPWLYKYGYSIGITKDAPDFSDENPIIAIYDLVCWAIENEYIRKEPIFKNKFGVIPKYTKVSFAMKHPQDWPGETTGTLIYQFDEWTIVTTNSQQAVYIDGNDSIDRDSIQPIKGEKNES